MKKSSIIFLYAFLISIFLGSCHKHPSTSIVHLNLKLENVENIILSSELNGFVDTLVTNDEVSISVSEPSFYTLDYTKGSTILYLKPGTKIDISNQGDTLLYYGDLAEENQFLFDLSSTITSSYATHGLITAGRLDLESFYRNLEERNAILNEVQTHYPNIDMEVTDLARKRINSVLLNDQLLYPRYYTYFNKDTLDLPDNYDSFLQNVELNDADLILFPEGKELITNLIQKDVELGNSVLTYFKTLYGKAEKEIKDPVVLDFAKNEYLTNAISFGGGLDSTEDLIESFLASVQNEKYRSKILGLVADWQDLKKGNPAPSFDGVTPEGDIVSLDDLAGKNVYIDVWATWCGPCIAEIPALKKIEATYENDNIAFVSVSIDQQKDQEKWRKFVKSKGLGGIQLFEENDWKSELTKAYNIKGIPRFILIDANGKIVSANAPRPSNPELKSLLDAL